MNPPAESLKRWKVLIILHLFRASVLRFSELGRAIPAVSQKMLIQQLRDLEGNGADELEDAHAPQILLQSIKTLVEKGLGGSN